MKEQINTLPALPGVYQYFDKNGKLLYIGKAKNLKKRVKSYFRFTPKLHPNPNLTLRILKMVKEITKIEYIVVNTENDALILENSLIKQLKPKYNILLRDDKTYPYIYIDLNEPFARFEITRKAIKKKNIKYFGPFVSGAKEILKTIYEEIPLVQQKNCLKHKKACMFYQINRCKAPCEGKISQKEYFVLIKKAITYIQNKQQIINILEKRMIEFANNLQFEQAQICKKRIESIKNSQTFSEVDLLNEKDLDVFYIYKKEKKGILIMLFLRNGKVISSDYSKVNIENRSTDELYKRIILDFYTKNTPCKSNKILIPHKIEDMELIAQTLYTKYNKKLSITTPTTKEKKKIIEICKLNAIEVGKKEKDSDIYEEIQKYFNLSNTPYCIEVFDTSHMFGRAIVGAKIVWENDKFNKQKYRHYNLLSKDEYSQIRELLLKRAESFQKSSPPDLWLIDGGVAQINIAQEIVDSTGIDIDILGIAKEKINHKAHRAKGKAKDTIYSPQGQHNLEQNNKILHFLQKLRDEAHRFAISFHRKQKQKQDKQIELLQVNGVGKAKVIKLINYFGSFENIKTASKEELSKVVDAKTASNIFDFFSLKR